MISAKTTLYSMVMLVTFLISTNRATGSSVTPKKIIRNKSLELLDIPRYFTFSLTPSERREIEP